MNKAFITKYPTEVDNNKLPKLGYLVFSDLGKYSGGQIQFNGSELTLLNKGEIQEYKTSKSLGTTVSSIGIGYKLSGVDNNSVLRVSNKYNLTTFIWTDKPTSISINDVRFIKNLDTITLSNASGDISSLIGLTNLQYLYLSDTSSLTGDISSLSGLTSLQELELVSTSSLTGDISSLSGLTNVRRLVLDNCNLITGTFTDSMIESLNSLKSLECDSKFMTEDIRNKFKEKGVSLKTI